MHVLYGYKHIHVRACINVTGKFEFSLMFARNIDTWAIEGICKPVYYSKACRSELALLSHSLYNIII